MILYLTTKKEALLTNADVRRWYNNLARASRNTSEVRLRRLSRFCEANKLTPKTAVQLARKSQRKLEDLLEDYVTTLENEGKAPGYITGILKAVKSWLSHNEIEIGRKIKVSNPDSTPSLENERVPEKEELRGILMNGTPRANAIIVLMAEAGLRPESLGDEAGTDGLNIGDLPELRIENDRVTIARIPTIVKVRAPISKGRHAYFTFLPREGCEYLVAYLNRRLAAGERLSPETPIIKVKSGFERMGKSARNKGSLFVSTKNISREVRLAIRASQFNWRPYVLRAYFDTQLLEAENHGKITHSYRVFFMGHKGDMEARYTTNKAKLPDHLVEDMRFSFQNCEPYLTTARTETLDKKQMLLEMFRKMAEAQNINPMDVTIAKQKQKGRELTVEEESEALMAEIKKHTLRQQADPRIIMEQELGSHLAEGWDFVTTLPSGKILVRK